jgi:hypothetical protein
VTRRPWQQFLGGCLFVLSPVLVARLGHDTLCAHWLIVGLLYLGFRECPDAAAARRLSWLAAGAAALSASIHPDLAVTCWVLAQAVYLRLWRSQRLTLSRAAGAGLATTGAVLVVFGAIGYLGTAQLATQGFGTYTSNTLTLVNPMGFSRVLPSVGIPADQWEGFGFLGIGGMALLLPACFVVVGRRPSSGRHAWPVLAAGALMAIYAVSTVVTVGEREVLRVGWLTPLGTPFRASGRFIWSLHYMALLFGIWGATRAFGRGRPGIATALLAGAVALQAGDLKTDPHWLAAKDFRPAPISNLKIALGHYRHVALYPMQVLGACGGPYDEERGYRYMYLAYRLDSTYNSGVFARVPAERVSTECRRFDEAVEGGQLDPETLYVLLPESLAPFEKAGAACGQFDRDWMCVSRDSYEPFRRYLLEHGRSLPVR